MSVPYPVIPSLKTLQDCITALNNIRSYFNGLQNQTTSSSPKGTLASARAVNPITVGASPFTFYNKWKQSCYVIISGGTVADIKYSRNQSTFYETGVTSGMLTLSPGDALTVTYSVVPNMVQVPQ